MPLYIDKTQAGKPVPTNAWWTDLAVSKYSGDLWADPLVDKNSAQGTTIYYPTNWNSDGTARVLDAPLTVGGSVVPAGDPSDVMMADFEGTTFPAGWTTNGNAFDGGPSSGTATGQSGVSGFIGNGLANSFTNAGGDGATGTLDSPTFTVDRKYLAFMVGGGNHPGDEEVRLVVNGQTVDSATGNNSEQLSWVNWDLSAYAGQQAQIQVVDNLTAGWAHIMVDQIVRTDNVIGLDTRFDTAFNAESSRALSWGDWNVSWRMQQTGGDQYMDVTAARGEPYTWFEFNQVTPQITVQNDATFADANGDPVTFPITTDTFSITQGGRTFGIHAPANSTFTRNGNVIDAALSANYLVVSALPTSGATLGDMQKYAFAIPRNTVMSYNYSADKAQVSENWSVTTDALQGTNHDTIQGWLSNEWRDTTNNLQFQPFTYQSPRGQIKTTIGHDGWNLNYTFEGLSPFAPAPQTLGLANDYSVAQMKSYVDNYSQLTSYGGDTYWGGKDLQQYAEYMEMAKQIGDTTAFDKLKTSLETALTDWYTYTPGESTHYFARYDTWGALIGFGDSYGSYQFTDNHFHYGYFTLATALLAFEDPAWAKGYGAMATQVAKQYANWDRSDTSYPYLRTFDVWEGHSYAGGFSSPGGNNQESSSEAIQSWAGLFLLGTALGNTQMQAAGAMGYVSERAAVQEDYLNQNGNPNATPGANPNAVGSSGPGTFPASYTHTTTGILFDSGQAFATYFSGDPAWIYGIQWMPTAPWFNYLGWDPKFSQSLVADAFNARPATLGAGVPGDDGGNLAMATKQWYGIGTYGADKITQDRTAAIGSIESAITEAYQSNPGAVSALTAANPLYDQASGKLLFGIGANGLPTYDAAIWSPDALPASLVPPEPPVDKVDADPKTWDTGYSLFALLVTNYSADNAAVQKLYNYNVASYTPGVDTAQAEQVYSRMGDGLANVVLGMEAQADPNAYADIHTALAAANDPVATNNSMAGAVYYNAMSNRGLGTETLDRHTSDPASQVYYNSTTKQYSYVLFNPSDTQQGYTVYDHETAIGTIQVPAHTEVDHHLDASLDHINITAAPTTKTVQPGQSVQFTATGIDQYGATIPLPSVDWTVNGGGTIDSNGTFIAATDDDSVTVTASSGGKSATHTLRVGPAPVLTTITVSPGFSRVVTGKTASFTAAGLDQYGDPIDTGAITWGFSGNGTVDATGVLTAGTVGAGYLTATAGTVIGSSVVSVIEVPTDIAMGKPVTASSELGGNVAGAAVDGDATTRWESAYSDNQWLQVDLGKVYDLSSVQIDWENAAASQYTLETSNSPGGPWKTIATVNKTAATPDDVAVKGKGRYVRMAGSTRLTQYGFSIYGMRIFGTPSLSAITPTNLLVTPTQATVLEGKSVNFDAYAFDAAGNGGGTAASWSIDNGGTIDGTGNFAAGDAAGSDTVTAQVDGLTATAAVTVKPLEPVAQHAAENIAIGKPVTVSSSENGGDDGSNAVDGSDATRWSSQFSDDQWIQVDLGSVVPISSIGLDWQNAYGKSFNLQVRNSPDDAWTTVATETAGSGGKQSYPVTATGRYVRMVGLTRGTQYGYSLYELSVFSTQGAPTPDLAEGQPTTASSSESDALGPSQATDNDSSSRWASGWSDNQWLTVDLGSVKPVSSATINWENAYASQYVIEGRDATSDDWTTLATVDNGNGGTDQLALSGSYRYIRMQGVQRGTPYGYSIIDFEIR
jgi:hypothetical protein